MHQLGGQLDQVVLEAAVHRRTIIQEQQELPHNLDRILQ
jgi:hypothetical protein